ncbi:flagellar hook-length control protein FliK [Gammaproteobacteria bacterium]
MVEKPALRTNPVAQFTQSSPAPSPVLTAKSVEPPKPPLVGSNPNQGTTQASVIEKPNVVLPSPPLTVQTTSPDQPSQVRSNQNLLAEGTPVFATNIVSPAVGPQTTVPETSSVELVRTVLSKPEIGNNTTSESFLQSISDETVPSLGKSKNALILGTVQQDTTATIVTPTFSQSSSSQTNAVSPETPLPLASPQLETELSQRVHWAVQHQTQQVELRVTPPNLGPLDLQVELKDGQALVSFTTPHAIVRDAIETALPKLREMLEGQGLRLADAGVHQQGSGSGARGERWQPQQTPWGERRPFREDSPSEPLPRRNPMLSRGRKIDYFA